MTISASYTTPGDTIRTCQKARQKPSSLGVVARYPLQRRPYRKSRQRNQKLKLGLWQGIILDGFADERGNARLYGAQESVEFGNDMPVGLGCREPKRTSLVEAVDFVDKALKTILAPDDTSEYVRCPFGYRRGHLFPDMCTAGRNQRSHGGKVAIDRRRADAGALGDVQE